MVDEKRGLTEKELRVIAERAFNPLVQMAPGARRDIQDLVRYIGDLRTRIQFMHEELTGARETIMIVCKRAEDLCLRVADEEVQMLDPQDVLRVDNVEEDGKVVKVFRYDPKPRIIQ